MQQPTAGLEHSRADARRNRAKVMVAAQQAFSRHGMSVSLGEVARRAGVGAGTVYRHFPTKEILIEAVLSQRIERMTRLATEYSRAEDPGEAFFDFIVELITTTPQNRDMCELMKSADGWPRSVLLSSTERFTAAVGALLEAAQRAGAVRRDLDVEGIEALFAGCVAMQLLEEDPSVIAPMTGLVIDALRPGASVTDSPEGTGNRYGMTDSKPNRNGARLCGSCGRSIAHEGAGRPPRFCGSACRQRAYRQRRRSAA